MTTVPELFATATISRRCYACENDLTGKRNPDRISYDGEKIEGEFWICECESRQAVTAYCPICDDHFETSAYLATAISDPKTLWLANMVTHYRHEHRAWDRSHGFISRKYGQQTYERQKRIINEQAKRQIIRKATKFLIDHGITADHFRALQNTDEKTIELAVKKVG